MMFFTLLLSVIFVIVNSRIVPSTVTSINIPNYLGHWIQVYGSPTNVIFQGYGTCITADYWLLDNGDINVINTQLDKNQHIEQITGYGYYKNVSEPGKLTVHLEGVPVDAPYWIVQLGEIVENQYQYAIITTPSYISLWVLVRDIDVFDTIYNAEVIEFLNKYNFRYTSIDQTDCKTNYNYVVEKPKNHLRSNYQSECDTYKITC